MSSQDLERMRLFSGGQSQPQTPAPDGTPVTEATDEPTDED